MSGSLSTIIKLIKNGLKKLSNQYLQEEIPPIEDFQYLFNKEFTSDEDKRKQWKAFLNRTDIELEQSFGQIVSEIEGYLGGYDTI